MKEFATVIRIFAVLSCFLPCCLPSTTTAPGNTCPPYFIPRPGSNSCYRIVLEHLTWFQANQYCTFYQPSNYGCHLTAIESEEEFHFLVERITDDPEYIQYDFWISLNNLDRNREWVWSSTNRKLGSGDRPGNGTTTSPPPSGSPEVDFVKDPYFNNYRKYKGRLVPIQDTPSSVSYTPGVLNEWVSNYTNWAPGEPSNSGKCGILWRAYQFRWADTSCYNFQGFPFICELHV